MRPAPHGTNNQPGKMHPVFDLDHWMTMCSKELPQHNFATVSTPLELARREYFIELAKKASDLGRTTPVDSLVWSSGASDKSPWLTRLGGAPWRQKGKEWPKRVDGTPLTFLFQISFVDSLDLFPFELPGEIALVFGDAHPHDVSIEESSHLEWTNRAVVTDPMRPWHAPLGGVLHLEYHGVLHRTSQYVHTESVDAACKLRFGLDGWRLGLMETSAIGTNIAVPQGDACNESEGDTLICAINSFLPHGHWPLCDVRRSWQKVLRDGTDDWDGTKATGFQIGDSGSIWIWRGPDGEFELATACE